MSENRGGFGEQAAASLPTIYSGWERCLPHFINAVVDSKLGQT